jgi:hypothetical protein
VGTLNPALQMRNAHVLCFFREYIRTIKIHSTYKGENQFNEYPIF